MTEEERKRYFGALVENLYGNLRAISEGTKSKEYKREMATRMIYDFYTDHKEDYKIESIEEITKELDRVDRDMKKLRGEKELEDR